MGTDRSPLLRTRMGTIRWYVTRPALVRTLGVTAVALALVGAARVGAEGWNDNQPVVAVPNPTVTITTTATATATATPTMSIVATPSPSSKPTRKPSPVATATKTVTAKPKPSQKPDSGGSSRTQTIAKTVTCVDAVTLEVSASGKGTVSVRISGPVSASGGRSAKVDGPAGSYRVSATASGGSPHMDIQTWGCTI